MLDFRKVLLALSIAGLGLVGTASAQVPNFTVGGTTGYVAAEGTTEQLPNLTLTETAATAITGAPTFLLTSNVPFANQLIAGSTSHVDVVVTDGTAADASTSATGAVVTQPGPTTIQITFPNGITAPTPVTITVTNIRVNASQAPVSSEITISVAATGVTITPNASSVNLGFVAKAISAVTINALAAIANTSSCGLLKTTVFPVSSIAISEAYPTSLKAVTDTTGGNAVTQPTTLAITLTNLDPGVDYYIPPTITVGTLVVTAMTAGSGGVAATPVASGTGAGSILVTSAAPTIWYAVTTSGGATVPTITIPVTASVPSVSGVTTFNTSPIGASVVLVGAASPSYLGYSGAITYTSSAPPTANNGANGLITACATVLLFPYVTNNATYGYDTGFAISNASTLPTGIAGITAASGSCTVSFYGTGAATTAPVTVNYGTVTTGTIGTPFSMSQSAAAGLTGYAVAVCNFVGAHGYAFVSDFNNLTDATSTSYIAVILASGADTYAPAPAATLTPAQ